MATRFVSARRGLTRVGLGTVSFAVLALGSPAAADRPGTPNNQKASPCYNSVTQRPAVCVEFYNTATERVTFDIEFGVGDRMWSGPRPNATCLTQGNYNCNAAANFGGGGWNAIAEGRTGETEYDRDGRPVGAHLPQGFRVEDLEYETRYCFRFKARRVSDDMVSEVWSGWACAETGAPPPKPTRPEVTAKYFPPGRVDPPKVVVTWTSVPDAVYEVNGVRMAPGKRELVHMVTEEELGTADTPAIVFTVCAVNLRGRACAEDSTFDLPEGIVAKPGRVGAGDVMAPEPSAPPAGVVARPGRAAGAYTTGGKTRDVGAAVAPRSASNACQAGFQWRLATPADQVCVTPEAAARTAQENAVAASRVDPNGPYGPHTCVSGYVWREAFAGDLVCVTPAVRDLVRQENAVAASRRGGP